MKQINNDFRHTVNFDQKVSLYIDVY